MKKRFIFLLKAGNLYKVIEKINKKVYNLFLIMLFEGQYIKK